MSDESTRSDPGGVRERLGGLFAYTVEALTYDLVQRHIALSESILYDQHEAVRCDVVELLRNNPACSGIECTSRLNGYWPTSLLGGDAEMGERAWDRAALVAEFVEGVRPWPTKWVARVWECPVTGRRYQWPHPSQLGSEGASS